MNFQILVLLIHSESLPRYFPCFRTYCSLWWQVFIWNMENFDCVTTTETHSLLVTDVRFRSGSTIFATSSFDRSVRLWDAARVSCHLSLLFQLSLCIFDNFKSSILFRVWIIFILPSACFQFFIPIYTFSFLCFLQSI